MMNKLIKKGTTLSLCLLLILPCTAVPVLAQDQSDELPAIQEIISETSRELLLEPRFDYISRISSSLSISAGLANCTGSFTIYSEYKSKLYVVLQQFKDNRWNEYQSWSESYSDSGPKLLEKQYNVPKGYRYRVITTVVILDKNGGELERVACNSPIKEY